MTTLYLVMKQGPIDVSVNCVFSTKEEAEEYCNSEMINVGTGMWKALGRYYYIEQLEFEPRVNFGT